METDDVSKLAAYIREKGCCRIGVDGTNGAGKSTFSAALASALGIFHLNLDRFSCQETGRIFSLSEYDEIKQKISYLDGYVIDGVCLLRVLEEIDNVC